MNEIKVGIISGYFNPIHAGHIDYINASKDQCDYLICIVNNDDQVIRKQSDVFMDEQHRLKIVSNIRAINKALISIDDDSSVAKTLNNIAENVPKNCRLLFFNSGDRFSGNENAQEARVCEAKNIERVFIKMPKIYSSSELKRNLSTQNIKKHDPV